MTNLEDYPYVRIWAERAGVDPSKRLEQARREG